ncbi:LPXTG-motif protein cell wall anchor domain protein [Peptoniphilus harei]|uniref:LPXTG-motif protein cell wall anchor domain protein n=1 Tax=Peptoniphilus harei TaxID=54005 RepID=A0A133PJI8_9FIRM|nr:SpaH/EbpB family LPXTG-anchored major pilin [Peptoniphilus harei]KXA28707.1 LPXTG-motif protein cell wall anchor domain protein [Peptoniphilus harei]
MNKKKILSLIMALVMLVGVFSPLTAMAEGGSDAKPSEKKDGPDTIEVNVHKILMNKTDLEAHGKKSEDDKKYDPTKKLEDQGKTLAGYFGNSAKEIDGVYFVAFKEGEDGYDNFDTMTEEQRKTAISTAESKTGETRTGKTTANGIALTLKSPGKYKIYEVKSKSTYEGADKEILAESLAVPVVLDLPDHARTQTGVANSIHVYPKNTEDGPKVDKFVKQKGGTQKDEKKEQSFDKTEEHTWVIRADIPTGMKDYQLFELDDTLQDSLTYVQGQTVNVQVVTKGTDTVDTNITLTKGTDYTLTEPTGDGGKLNVKFTATGIAKLAGAEGKQVKVEFNTTINDKAVMSKNIPNDVTLNYGHDPNKKKEKKPDENPRVYTGGKKFIKIDSSQNKKALQGAKFVIKNSEGKYLSNKNNKYEWITVTDTATDKLLKNTDLLQLESGQDGKFEIKGLKYDRPNGTKYKLVEVQAPENYALPSNNEFEFTVDDNSYYKDAKAVDLVDADPQEVDNKKVTIPQTGGMGTVLFTVVGISLMAGAVIAMKKNREEA